MSYTNLHSYTVDGYQRVSYCRASPVEGPAALVYCRDGGNEGDNASGDGIVITKNLILGCKPETADDFRPFIFEPTWCVYIRSQDNIDMGSYVRRVTFRMSPRLPLRLHVADTSPFEITEVLSTDFPIELQVDYLDATMSPTTYLYKPNDVFDGKYNVDLRMNFQGHERKDKMIFVNPPHPLKLVLTTPPASVPLVMTPTVSSRLQGESEKVVRRPKVGLSPNIEKSKMKVQEHVPITIKLPHAPRPIFNVRTNKL